RGRDRRPRAHARRRHARLARQRLREVRRHGLQGPHRPVRAAVDVERDPPHHQHRRRRDRDSRASQEGRHDDAARGRADKAARRAHDAGRGRQGHAIDMSVQVFLYHACDASGVMTTGKINAESQADALSKLRAKALMPVKLQAAGQETASSSGRKISAADVADFTTSLAILVEARVPLDKAMNLLHGISPKDQIRNLVVSLREDIKEGKSLAEAMSRFPKIFSRLYVRLVKAGEAGGILDKLLPELAEFIQTSDANKKAVVSALTYPAILCVVGLL